MREFIFRVPLFLCNGAETRYNMTGRERALVYRLALETGLRANELRTYTHTLKEPVFLLDNG